MTDKWIKPSELNQEWQGACWVAESGGFVVMRQTKVYNGKVYCYSEDMISWFEIRDDMKYRVMPIFTPKITEEDFKMANSNISIQIEFLAGTSIEQALEEARTKAVEWNVAYTTFDFNGVKVSCSEDFDVDYWAHYEYPNVMKEKKTFMICTRRGEK